MAVQPNFVYVKIKDIKDNKIYILAECRLKSLYKKKTDYELLDKYQGVDLLGIEYIPPFPWFDEERRKDGCFRILSGEFVTDDTGTGIVHIAPAYGADDYEISVRDKIIKPDNPLDNLDDSGYFYKDPKLDFLQGVSG